MKDWDFSKTWYHGSPSELTVIRKGSSITQDRKLAEVFSHRPPHVLIWDSGDVSTIKHNGNMPGYLYRVDEEIGPEDIAPNLATAKGREWVTNRDLRVALIGPVAPLPEDLLTEEEIRELQRKDAK